MADLSGYEAIDQFHCTVCGMIGGGSVSLFALGDNVFICEGCHRNREDGCADPDPPTSLVDRMLPEQ